MQRHLGPDGTSTGQSEVTYSRHRLQIRDEARTVILELGSGAMIYVDPASEQWARVTLEQLVAMRDAKLAELEERIRALPPELQAQFREQLEAQKRADQQHPQLVRTDRTETVSGYACRVHRWRTPEGSGEACIARELPVDMSSFRQDVEALGTRLVQVGAGRTIGSMDFLRLGEEGFPVRTQQRVELAPGQTVEATSVFGDFGSIPPTELKPPAEYREVDFQTLMKEVATRRGPGAPP